MEYRYYQNDANEAIKKDLSRTGNSLVVIPTAGGKSHVIAYTAQLSESVLILQPTRELLAQNMEKLSLIVPKEDIGAYSASFKSREIKKFTFATIQSVYKKPELFVDFDLILIDECHLLNPKDMNTMFISFISKINEIRSKM